MTKESEQQAVPVAQELPEVMPGHWSSADGLAMAMATLDDPHMAHSRERISDFALANEVYLSPGIANLTDAKERIRWLSASLAVALSTPSEQFAKSSPDAEETARDKAIAAMRAYLSSAGVPATEFDPEFAVRMMGAMMVSFHKYGRVADAYPLKFDAASDVRARMAKYRETGNKHYLVDAANFAMIEAMHSGRKGGSQWGTNDAADSPGRTTASGHRLVQETNDGTRIMGETILHIPGDDA